jgi:hypothetical protein
MGKAYQNIPTGHLVFSRDGAHLAYAASQGESRFVVLDGEGGPGFEALVLGGDSTVVFDAPDRLHYLGVRGREVYLVEVALAPAP